MSETRISVLMSTYKEPLEWTETAINSILNQTYHDIELVVIVDDPQNKELIEKLQEIQSKNKALKIIVNRYNMGLVKSLNNGLNYCTGKYIARMDADDISLPTRLEEELNFLTKYGYDIVGCRFESFFENEVVGSRAVPSKSNICAKMLKYTDCVAHPTWLVKKDVYKNLEGYREIDACEDYDFLIRASLKGYEIACINKCLFRYRHNPESISSKNTVLQGITSNMLRKFYRSKKVWAYSDYLEWRGSDAYVQEQKVFQKYLICREKIENGKYYNVLQGILRLVCSREGLDKVYSKLSIILLQKINDTYKESVG